MAVKRKSRNDLMDKIIGRVNVSKPRSDGKGTFQVSRSTTAIAPRVKYILKTGLSPLDGMIGDGICFGRITEIYGLDASGKTALARACMVQAQKKEIYECVNDGGSDKLKKIDDDVEVARVFLDNEQSIDRDEKMFFSDPVTGDPVEIDCVLGDCDTIDQMFKIVDRTIQETKKHSKDIGKPCLVVIIVDTVAGTASKEELVAEWGKDDYSRQPKQLREGFRRLAREVSRNNVCLICTNQVSDNYRASKVSHVAHQEQNYSVSGGRALKYWASLRLFMFQVDVKYKLTRTSKFAAGYLIGFYTKKNRRVKPLREGRLALLFHDGRGLDPIFSMLETLIYLGFAEVSKMAPYDISFKFSKWGVQTSTFGTDNAGKELEDEDDHPRRGRNPRLADRSGWPQFYVDHSSDVNLLWERAMAWAFSTEGLNGQAVDIDDDDDDDDMDDIGGEEV